MIAGSRRALATRGKIAAPMLLASLALLLNGCAAIEGIFKAGLWVGVVAVVAIVVVIGGVAMLVRR